MQNSSVLCSSNSLSPSLSLSTPHRFPAPLQNRCATAAVACSSGRLPSCCWQIRQSIITPLHSTATQEIVETSKAERGFVEVGYISSVQGLQGEVRVKSSSDFPELRFAKPGRRWLRQEVLGREAIREVELLQGRAHPGKKSWTVKFKTINTVDQAQLLIGSTILVSEEDKPELEEGEFYSNDLLGMRVILKETAEPVGTVVNIVNTGASDVLQVMLNSSTAERSESEASASGPLVWVPFVEAIVPIVDLNKREMLITPPKGLLDLNIRSDERSKKERRQIEWKERKKFQKRLIAAKKKLCEMEQQHVFHGFRHGERSQTSTLADQIVNVNSKLLHQALQNLDVPSSKRWNFHEFMEINLAKDARSTLRISETCLSNSGRGEKVNSSSKLQEKGHLLTSEGKVATVLYVDDYQRKGSSFSPDLLDKSENSSHLLVERFFHDNQRLKTKERDSMPLILVCPAHEIQPLQNAFKSDNYFGFDSTKVSFLEEERLPIVSTSLEEQSKYKILMKSPWEILQKPVGTGGVISLLSSNNILDNLTEMGVEYIQVCCVGQRSIGGHTMLGLVSSCEANIGIQSCKGINGLEDNFDMVFSMTFMKHLIKNMNKFPFDAIPKAYPHVEKVDDEWVDIVPSDSNSYELHCSIYGSLNLCPPDKVCLMEVTE